MPKAKAKLSQAERKRRQTSQAIHDRMQRVVQVLEERHIKKGFKPDLTEPRYVLRYLAGQAAGNPPDQIDESRVIMALSKFNISTDWLLTGDMNVMIARAIADSPAAKDADDKVDGKKLAEAGDILSELETPLHQVKHLAQALRMIGTSDDVQRDVGAAIDTVADQALGLMAGILEQRDKAWRLVRQAEKPAA